MEASDEQLIRELIARWLSATRDVLSAVND
jgi:hypothetical protein